MNSRSTFPQQYRNTQLLFGFSLIGLVGLVCLWWNNIYEDKEKELNALVEENWSKAMMDNYIIKVKEMVALRAQAKNFLSQTADTSQVAVDSNLSNQVRAKDLKIDVYQLQNNFDDRLLENNLSNIEYRLVKEVDGKTVIFKDSSINFFNKESKFRPELQGLRTLLLKKMWFEFLIGVILVIVISIAFAYSLRIQREQYQINQMRSDLVSNITHELRTPIFTVSAALEALDKFDVLEDAKRTKEYLQISQNELQRLSFLVDKVLNSSLHEEGKIKLQKEPVNLPELVEGIKQSLFLQLEQQNAQLEIQTIASSIWANIDKVHLTNVVYNLIDNGLKYNESRPAKIKIEITEQDNDVMLRVMDNGIGIPKEYRHNIFDKIF